MEFRLLGFYIIHLISEISARQPRNVVLNQQYKFICQTSSDTEFKATDGLMNTGHEMPGVCSPDEVWVNVAFKRPALIYEIVVNLGRCGDCGDETINKFVGTLIGPQFPKKNISQVFPHNSKIGTPLRMQFPIAHGHFSRNFHLQNNKGVSLLSKKINLMELEVLEYNVSERIFIGCYQEPREGYTAYKFPSKNCKWLCTQKLYRLFAYHSTHCRCMDNAPGRISDPNKCAKVCYRYQALVCPNVDASITHQGLGLFLAYPNIPKYIGCYNMFSISQKDDIPDITPAKCMKKCTEHEKLYAAINSQSCYCTDDLETTKVDDITCNTPCPSAIHKICGGASQYSIFTSFYGGPIHPEYNDLYHCKDKNYDDAGQCLSSCEVNFTGPRCDEFIIRGTSDFPWENIGDEGPAGKSSLGFWIMVSVIGFIVVVLIAGAGYGFLGEE